MNKYDILGVSRSVSYRELKVAYQAAARATHPDKLFIRSRSEPEEEASARFLRIQDAWETLREEDLRREYDDRLDLQAKDVVVSEEVKLGEMIYEESDGGSYSHECRCGDRYVASAAELREGFEVLDCGGCSLYIRVLGKPARAPEEQRAQTE